MAKPFLGKSLRSDWFFLNRDFAVWTDWNFTEISKMDEEDEHSPSEVSIILNIWKFLMQKVKAASPKARRPKTILSTKQKSSNTNKKTVTDMNTLLRCIEANLVWKMRKLEAYLRLSLTTFCRNLIERTEEKRRRIRASDSFQFPDQYKLTAIHAFNISKDNDFKKSRKVLAAKRKSLVLTRSSYASKNCVVVFIQHLGLRAREYQSSDPLLSSTAPVFTGANIGSISRCTLQIFHGSVKIAQNERKRRIVIAAMRTIDFEAIFVN